MGLYSGSAYEDGRGREISHCRKLGLCAAVLCCAVLLTSREL